MFQQEGNGHCLICHSDTKQNDSHGVRHIGQGLSITPCNDKCDPYWKKAYEELWKTWKLKTQ